MDKWQPIETAPKDGHQSLFWNSELEMYLVLSWVYDRWCSPSLDDYYLESDLSCWRQLPSLPKKKHKE